MCGGARALEERHEHIQGLSPRVRGSPATSLLPARQRRSIPACAGEPSTPFSADTGGTVYPRVCGGAPGRYLTSDTRVGSIPACAGEPQRQMRLLPMSRVYPRVCGGACRPMRSLTRRWGLSPRVRGSLRRARERLSRSRSIPACAGEPSNRWVGIVPDKVYPRVCGGAYETSSGTGAHGGLSPRVRGSRLQRKHLHCRLRSIPACAGEPSRAAAAKRQSTVYPRVCGGAAVLDELHSPPDGLSPRVRGSRAELPHWSDMKRSIPACAGEPK